jgi:hypothetical protein
VRAPARNLRWLNPAPSTSAKGRYLVGARKQLSARWRVVNMPKATGDQKTPRLARGFPMCAFLTINPRAGRNARPYPRKFLNRCKIKPCRTRPEWRAADASRSG